MFGAFRIFGMSRFSGRVSGYNPDTYQRLG
jgi:hypothetical protein